VVYSQEIVLFWRIPRVTLPLGLGSRQSAVVYPHPAESPGRSEGDCADLVRDGQGRSESLARRRMPRDTAGSMAGMPTGTCCLAVGVEGANREC
jgi:hypothetical protein